MYADTAAKLAARLTHSTPDGATLTAKVTSDRIEFIGGRWGAHSIALDVSSEARVLAHWDGYCEAQAR